MQTCIDLLCAREHRFVGRSVPQLSPRVLGQGLAEVPETCGTDSRDSGSGLAHYQNCLYSTLTVRPMIESRRVKFIRALRGRSNGRSKDEGPVEIQKEGG